MSDHPECVQGIRGRDHHGYCLTSRSWISLPSSSLLAVSLPEYDRHSALSFDVYLGCCKVLYEKKIDWLIDYTVRGRINAPQPSNGTDQHPAWNQDIITEPVYHKLH